MKSRGESWLHYGVKNPSPIGTHGEPSLFLRMPFESTAFAFPALITASRRRGGLRSGRLLHLPQIDVEGAAGEENLPQRKHQRNRHQHDTRHKQNQRAQLQQGQQQQHRSEAAQQADDTDRLTPADQFNAYLEIPHLGQNPGIAPHQPVGMQFPHQCRKMQKAVRVGEKQQRYRRKQNRRSGGREFHKNT